MEYKIAVLVQEASLGPTDSNLTLFLFSSVAGVVEVPSVKRYTKELISYCILPRHG
jgi:hypothetical protein